MAPGRSNEIGTSRKSAQDALERDHRGDIEQVVTTDCKRGARRLNQQSAAIVEGDFRGVTIT